MVFYSFKELIAFLQKRMYVEYEEAFTMAWELVVSKEILWDTGFNGYIWPNDLTEETCYDVLDLGIEQDALPF